MTTGVMVAAGLGALYAAAGIIGSIVQTASGVPFVAGIIMVIIAPVLVVFALNLFRRFGLTTLMCCIYGLLVYCFE